MTHDGLTQRLLDAMARHPGERRTAREWTGALPPLTPTGHVLHRLTRLANEGRVQWDYRGRTVVYFWKD